jgi:hypothetical protein
VARGAVRLAGLVVAAAAFLLGGALALDRVFPPDLARAATASTDDGGSRRVARMSIRAI